MVFSGPRFRAKRITVSIYVVRSPLPRLRNTDDLPHRHHHSRLPRIPGRQEVDRLLYGWTEVRQGGAHYARLRNRHPYGCSRQRRRRFLQARAGRHLVRLAAAFRHSVLLGDDALVPPNAVHHHGRLLRRAFRNGTRSRLLGLRHLLLHPVDGNHARRNG